jgi:hypothetical protein
MDALKQSPVFTKIRWGRVLFAILAVTLIIWGITVAVKNARLTSTPDNIQRIKDQQIAAMENQWIGTSQNRQGIATAFQNANVPNSQRLLINASGLGVRLTGCLGPYDSPVFDEAAATRYALASGARCLVLEIDHPQNTYEPKLIYRNSFGMKKSLNMGNLEEVAKQIAGRAFVGSNDSTPWSVASDPLIVVLYFVSTPDPATSAVEYTRYLGRVAEALQPLKNSILGQTPQGDFRRQALESQLFYQSLEVLQKRIIVLCNVDTSVFRRLSNIGLAGELGAEQDLDLLVHARMYSRESPSGLGATSQPESTIQPSCVVTTPDYWLNTPPDRLADAVSQTKKAWTLVMNPIASSSFISSENLKKLLVSYGVQSVPITIFENQDAIKATVGKEAFYEKSSWLVKPELIRYVPVPPIVVQKPIPEANAGGGAIRSPM